MPREPMKWKHHLKADYIRTLPVGSIVYLRSCIYYYGEVINEYQIIERNGRKMLKSTSKNFEVIIPIKDYQGKYYLAEEDNGESRDKALTESATEGEEDLQPAT